MSADVAAGETGFMPVAGVELAAATAGIKASGSPDVALVRLAEGSHTVALFTRNAFRAAPVKVAQAHLAAIPARVLLINAGCANAGTGVAGEQDARDACGHAAAALGVEAESVLPFSTGLIGQRLPMDRLRAGIDDCVGKLSPDGWSAAATAIMTTDTYPKGCSRSVELAGGPVTVTGIAKGAGMIRPDMATMLAFIATDAVVATDSLEAMLRAAVDDSFHCITVDGDTSTNDAVTLSATGAAGVQVDSTADLDVLGEAVRSLCIELAQALVRDAEGATRLIGITVGGGGDRDECRAVAFTVAHSPLVKTAVHGGDPNWGRILAAVGRAPIADLDVGGTDIALGDVALVRRGEPVPGLDEAGAAAAVTGPEVRIAIDLGRGDAAVTVWTSDLSCDYVRINADYRT